MIELVVLCAFAAVAGSAAPSRPGLIRNRTEPAGKVMCRHCADDGLVVVWTRPAAPSMACPRASGDYDEMGPCPFCEQGLRVEFPPADPRSGAQRLGPWGAGGFWGSRQELRAHLEPSWFPPEERRGKAGPPVELRLRGTDGTADGPVERDPVARFVARLADAGGGACEDCAEQTDRRWRYGRRALCRACVVPRARAASYVPPEGS